jgi:hypothetical protein
MMPSGPGKYEGEPARTLILDHWLGSSGQDEMVADPDNGDGAALFRGVITIDDDDREAAREYGYTEDEIQEADDELEGTLGGCILRWGSTGFVTSTLYPYGDELYADWRAITAEYETDDEEGTDDV